MEEDHLSAIAGIQRYEADTSPSVGEVVVANALDRSPLLPSQIAAAVSLGAATGSLALGVGSFFSGLAIDGVKATTLTAIDLGRSAIQKVFGTANNGADRSTGFREQAAAETLLERSVSLSRCLDPSMLARTDVHLLAAKCAALVNRRRVVHSLNKLTPYLSHGFLLY